ncbi:MAG: hypothetical protein K2V38_14410 [Gemmataceae bacterium]|nr:hypothetical protein [Gemmataceae bacterium]
MGIPAGALAAASTALRHAADGASIAAEARNVFGYIEDQITVEVKGNPRSSKLTLYKLAAAAAFGLVKLYVPAGVEVTLKALGIGFLGGVRDALLDERQKKLLARLAVVPPPGAIILEHDASLNSVALHLFFRQSVLTANLISDDAFYRELPVLNGPADQVTGGLWQYRIGGKNLPLPYAGKAILTKDSIVPNPDPAAAGTPDERVRVNTPHPRPSGDARSRGSLVRFVQAALARPSEFTSITFPTPPTAPPGGVAAETRFSGG